jgi:hypothetical protein
MLGSRFQIPRFIPLPIRHHLTNPTPSDIRCRDFRTNPTPPDRSDGLLPPHNPSIVSSISTVPYSLTCLVFLKRATTFTRWPDR